MFTELTPYYPKIIGTIIVFVIFLSVRLISYKVIQKIASISEKKERRSKLIKKYISFLMGILFLTIVFLIWGVESQRALGWIGTIVAFIGVALFAQWSILSNVTAGIIMFFSFPYRIGDKIKIEDKDFPTEAYIDDIRAFHTILITEDGKIISFPNSLFLQKSVVILIKN